MIPLKAKVSGIFCFLAKDLNWNRGAIPLRTRRRNLRKGLYYVTAVLLWEGADTGNPKPP